MKKASKFCLIVLGALVVVTILGYIPIWRNDALARENKDRVNELVEVGQNLGEAEQILKDAGFQLVHDEAIAPTINKDYLQHLVIVGETQPNRFESFAYAAQLPWMPFTHSESAYVAIKATLDGTITKID